jgi:hypothetical protein
MGGSPDSGIVVELPLQSEDMKYETIIADPEHEVNIALPPPDALQPAFIADAETRLESEKSDDEFVPMTTLRLKR